MNLYPHHERRKDLPPAPPRIAKLPVDERGYPVPFFVAWINGKPEFRLAQDGKASTCHIQRLCWVCGEKLVGPKTFLIGPMCSINRVSSEPPSHYECANYSAQACPFLSKPQMVRREDSFMEKAKPFCVTPGIMEERNPGVTCLWTTATYERVSDGRTGYLFRLGPPQHIAWFSQGRLATRKEVMDSIRTGLPKLEALCRDANDRDALEMEVAKALLYIPTR